jgi:circadian clock protein KaiC
LQLNRQGVLVGKALEGFEGVLTGLPAYRGITAMMSIPDESDVG